MGPHLGKFDFFTSRYFSPGFRLSGAFLLAFGVLLFFVQAAVGVILIVTGIVILSTHYRLRIDTTNRVYSDYVWFLGFKIGPVARYSTIEYFFIKKNRESRTMNMRVASTVTYDDVYDGFLKFSEDNKIHIASKGDREAIINKLTPMSEALNVPIMDYSKTSPVA